MSERGAVNAWGRGSLDDYLKLSGQRPCGAVEAFDIFIRRNVDESLHAHLLDDDENDGQFVRDAIDRQLPRRITTIEELDALPEGTLIQAEHRPLVYRHSGSRIHQWHSLMDRYDRESRALPLPMLVLWNPDEDRS